MLLFFLGVEIIFLFALLSLFENVFTLYVFAFLLHINQFKKNNFTEPIEMKQKNYYKAT